MAIGRQRTQAAARELNKSLVSIPRAAEHESPGSWFTRAALSQGCAPEQLNAVLHLPWNGSDFDLIFAHLLGDAAAEIAMLKGLEPSLTVLRRLMPCGLKPSRHLVYPGRRKGPRAAYRYCPLCLQQAVIPCFPLHWRFKAYRVCTVHLCLMEDCCSTCGASVILPLNPMQFRTSHGYAKRQLASLAQCRGCGLQLAARGSVSLTDARGGGIPVDVLDRLVSSSETLTALLLPEAAQFDLPARIDACSAHRLRIFSTGEIRTRTTALNARWLFGAP